MISFSASFSEKTYGDFNYGNVFLFEMIASGGVLWRLCYSYIIRRPFQ